MPEVNGNVKKWKKLDNTLFNTQVEFFIVDTLLEEYILDNVTGVATLHYADGSIAQSTLFNEYFGNSNGGFKISFTGLPDYEYKMVRIDIQSPIQQMLDFQLNDIEEENIIDDVEKIAKPIDI